MSNKINTSIPSNTIVGARQISNQIKNLSLTKEAFDYLGQIQGKLRIEYSAESDKPNISIVDMEGKFLSTIREFEQLANYKTFISNKKEELDVEAKKDEQFAVFHNLRNRYEAVNGQGTLPERMLEANNSKFGQFRKSYENIEKHLVVIRSLPPNQARDYLANQGEVLRQFYLHAMSECMGPNKYEQETHDERLLGLGIPKWIENRFIDPNFTKDVKHDATHLIFPRGNFMKSISLQTREIKVASFMRSNQYIIGNSHSIIQLAGSAELIEWFIPLDHTSREELIAQWEKFNWPMLMPGNVDEFLQPRIDRVNSKPFSPTQAPKSKPGQKGFRPETPFQREIRELRNAHGKFLSTILDFYHLLPRVEDPIADFWYQVADTRNWIITPDRTIYSWLNETPNRDAVLSAIINNSMGLFKRKMAQIVGIQLEIPSSSPRYRSMEQIILATGANTTLVVYNDVPPRVNFVRYTYNVMTDDIKNPGHLTDGIRTDILRFRGKETEELLRSTKSRGQMIGKSKLKKATLKLLKPITDKALKESIETWIRENFRNEKMQELAAEYAATAIEDENLGYDSSDEEVSENEEE